MPAPDSPSGPARSPRPRDPRPEPLPPLVSAALEPAASLSERLARIAQHAGGRRYTVLGEVARGGMGTVLRAWDELLSREVAMKVVTRMPSDSADEYERGELERRLARFIDEARITAQLDHPGIVPVHEIGIDADGAVFFTMPLVRGRDLKHVFGLVARGEEGWTLQRALDVMHKVCLTVAFAHSKGVVHRDLKPENVMVGPYGEAYVMDWGLALLVGRIERGGIVGTPAYMAPEQARGRSHEVGAASDVYSLGAMLYELFARRMPHELSLETRGDEPLDDVLAAPPRPLAELAPEVPPELRAIAAKAMAADPRARYGSALDMAADLARWLAGRSVSVLPSSRWTRLVRWRARNRALALALDALVALGLAAGVGFAVQQRAFVRAVRAKHDEVLVSAYAAGLSAADLGLRAHESGEARRRLAACDPALRGWEWRHLALRADSSLRVLARPASAVRAVAVSPDGRTVAAGTDDGELRLVDPEGDAPRASLRGHARVVTAAAFTPDGRRLVSASRDKTVRVWDVENGALEHVLAAHEADVVALAVSPDGATLVSGDLRGTLVLSDLATGLPRARSDGPGGAASDGVVGLAFVGPGELAVAYISGRVRVHGPELGVLRETRASRTVPTAFAAAPEGCALALAADGAVLVLDAATLAPLATLSTGGSAVGALAFADGGAHEGLLASGGFDNVVRVFELATGRLAAELAGHGRDVNALAFLPDGRRLVSGSEDDTLRLWDLAREPVRVLEPGGWIGALAFTADGAALATGGRDAVLRIYDARTGAERATCAMPGIVDCIAAGAGDELVVGCGGPPTRVRASATPTARPLASRPGAPRTLVADPARGRLFSRDLAGTIRVEPLDGAGDALDLVTGDESASLALDRDGRLLAAGTLGGEVLVLDAGSLATLTRVEGSGAVHALAFAPDGRRLAAGRRSGAITLHVAPGWRIERTLAGHDNFVSCLAFAPDGSRLASGSYDNTLRVWDPANPEALLTLRGHGAAITSVAFSPGGEDLASASKDGSVRLWRTQPSFDSAPSRRDP